MIRLSYSISAVIVNHNGGELLRDCLNDLIAEQVDEIIVVDNASADGSAELLEASILMAGVRVLQVGLNIGYGAAANRGIAACNAPRIIVCNPDLRVHRGSIDILSAALESDPTLGVVGPCILEPDGSVYPSARRFPSLIDAGMHAILGMFFPNNKFTRNYRMQDGERMQDIDRMQDGESLEHSSPREVDWVSGAFFMARREAIEEIGGFDEGYFMYGEDVDLCWRIHQAGYGVAYIPEAVVTHERAYSTKKHPYRMLIEHHRSTIRFASRRYGGFSFALLAAPMAILLAVRAAIALIQQVAEDLRAYFT